MLSLIAVDFRQAGFDRLERLAGVSPDLVASVVARRDDVRGAVVLSTCNRFEAYLDLVDGTDPAPAHRDMVETAASHSGAAVDGLVECARVFHGHAVAEHLFAVSSGLESLVLGEGEIAGQVSRALEAARAAATTTSDLERVFQRASGASSVVQQRTELGSAGRSVVRLALDLAETRVTDWSAARVVLVGTGAYAGATLAALRDRACAKSRCFAERQGGAFRRPRGRWRALEAAELGVALGQADLVIACSIATTPIITAEQLRAARAAAGGAHRQLVIDMGLPRNVAPDAALLEHVDLLDLETLALHAPLPELQATADAHAVLRTALADYRTAQNAAEIAPAIVALRAQVQALVDAEIERLRRRGASSEAAERALRHLGSVFVHTPSARAREHAAAGEAHAFAEALGRVHGITCPAVADASAADGVRSAG